MSEFTWDERCLFYFPNNHKVALLGWYLLTSTNPDVWTARSTDGEIRADFPTEDEAKAFLTLVLGAAT